MKKQCSLLPIAALIIFTYASPLLAQENPSSQDPTGTVANADIGPSEQPIAFPHNIHAGDNQIDCQYCHFSAERSMRAGIPPVATCMGCHALVAGSQNPEEIALLRGYFERQEAIPWNRIYKVADHVQFPHMRHISAGVECANCHGNVQEIEIIQQVSQPLTMGWCVGCHIERGASRDCTVCHY